MSTELDRSLSREGDDTAARGQFHLVLSGKPLEATTHRGRANIVRNKHFICVRMLLSMHSVIIDLCDIHIHISACCYLTIPTLVLFDSIGIYYTYCPFTCFRYIYLMDKLDGL